MNFDSTVYDNPSRRTVVYATRGMVATGQPLAAQAGLDILKKGGNAVDAAIATAATLTVVEPTSNGIGGDNFALVWMKEELHGLNSSGHAPQAISLPALKDRGLEEIPTHGLIPVTVPGVPGGWGELSVRFGKLPLTEVLAPAISYAEEGFPVSPTVASHWAGALRSYSQKLKGEVFRGWFDTFAPGGRTPKAGEIVRLPHHARTLGLIAKTNGEAFYRGELAEKIHAFSREHDGFLRDTDLAVYKPEWVKPLSVEYRGYNVWEIPPNGHGIVALLALNIVQGFDFTKSRTIEMVHRQIEAMKLAYVDGRKYVADPGSMQVTMEQLLSKDYAKKRRSLIGNEALQPWPGDPASGGTVYLATADGDGNMVSMIQSNYMGFGSGVVIPETGIALHNRGHNFTLEEGHGNMLAPGKKPYHTIIPGFLTKDGKAVGPFGVMGGFMQPQGHLQVIMNTLDFGMNPQAALDCQRWMWVKDKIVEVEPGFPEELALGLETRGHIIRRVEESTDFGRGQIIWRSDEGVLCGGTEPRTDGCIAAW